MAIRARRFEEWFAEFTRPRWFASTRMRGQAAEFAAKDLELFFDFLARPRDNTGTPLTVQQKVNMSRKVLAIESFWSALEDPQKFGNRLSLFPGIFAEIVKSEEVVNAWVAGLGDKGFGLFWQGFRQATSNFLQGLDDGLFPFLARLNKRGALHTFLNNASMEGLVRGIGRDMHGLGSLIDNWVVEQLTHGWWEDFLSSLRAEQTESFFNGFGAGITQLSWARNGELLGRLLAPNARAFGRGVAGHVKVFADIFTAYRTFSPFVDGMGEEGMKYFFAGLGESAQTFWDELIHQEDQMLAAQFMGSVPQLKVKRSAAMVSLRCPFCLDTISARDASVECKNCGARLHAACAVESKGCPGCGNDAGFAQVK